MRPRIVVLDDDPTGSQTVHGCLLLLRWDEQTLRDALADDSPLFFVLTNTRSMTPDGAEATTREVCRALAAPLAGLVSRGEPWLVVSRSDSTLRGHYPVETDVISQELGPFDAHFIAPAFFEGGRITRGGTHHVVRDGVAVPANETEFARDSVFGYTTAYLPAYVEEKTRGRIREAQVEQIDPAQTDASILGLLRSCSDNRCVVVNATMQRELDRIAALVLTASGEGKRFLFRSAASLLTSLAALAPQPVDAHEMARYVPDRRPGLVLAGSHVSLSTRQLARLLEQAGSASGGARRLVSIELDVGLLPAPDAGDAAIAAATRELVTRIGERLSREHAAGNDVVLSTSRTERTFATAAERLQFGQAVSNVLMRVVAGAPKTLGFIVGKGGITSNDLLAHGLSLRSARVVGQIHPGCSVVLTPGDHRLGAIPVVIFPGNVGDDDSLALVYRRLTAAPGC